MKDISKLRLAILVLISAILACNVPGTTPSISINDQAATVIALTLQAQIQDGEVTMTATPRPLPTLPAFTTTVGATTPTITPTYSTPMLTVLQQTNCREGPGQDY